MTERQTEIRTFALRFLQSNGAKITHCSDGSVEVELPASLATSLDTPATLRLHFHPELATATSELLTFGHPLLDKMLALAGRRGLVTSLLFTFGLDSAFIHSVMTVDPFTTPPETSPRAFIHLARVFGRLRFTSTRFRLVGRRITHQLQVLFYFRVSLASDEKREYVVPILIDPATEEVDALVGLDEAVSFSLTKPQPHTKRTNRVTTQQSEPLTIDELVQTGSKQLLGDSYTILRLYRKACAHLELQMEPVWRDFTAESQARLARELERIEEYYRGLAQETLDPLRKVFRRMASLSVRTQLARSLDAQSRYHKQLHEMKQEATGMEDQYEEELNRLAAEKERRCNELVAKYQTKFELHLTNVAALRVPRVEYTLRLTGSSRRELVFWYDVLRERLVDLNCDVCQQPLYDIMLCSCGNTVCADCGGLCACGNQVCRECAAATCHVCGAPICADCHTGCPLQPGLNLTELAVCSHCRVHICSTCVRLLGEPIAMPV